MNKAKHLLWPPLQEIETRLFAPSDGLLQRWASEDPKLPEELRDALDKDPGAGERLKIFNEPAPSTLSDDIPIPPMPDTLRDAIRRRTAARKAHDTHVAPKPGQIRSVDEVIGPNGPLDLDLPNPLAVLLTEPTETDDVWYGWMVAPDVDYAGYWDVVLEPDDEPFEPTAAMIQLWNPVYVYLPSTRKVLGCLSPDRLKAIHATALEYTSDNLIDSNDTRTGYISRRPTLHGLWVLTGTPLGDPADPRHRYQQLYHGAAEALREPVRLAQGATTADTSLSALLKALVEGLRGSVEQAGLVWQPVPGVTHAMGGAEDDTKYFAIGDSLRLGLSVEDENGEPVLTLTVKLLARESWLVQWVQAHGKQSHELKPDITGEQTFYIDPAADDGRLVMEGIGGNGKLRLEMTMAELIQKPR